jgi:hypothetical protein
MVMTRGGAGLQIPESHHASAAKAHAATPSTANLTRPVIVPSIGPLAPSPARAGGSTAGACPYRAAISGAFPPTMMRVEVDGTADDEMHVDGYPWAKLPP